MSLTNSQYDEIIRDYNRIGLINKREQNERIAIIYDKIPRIKEINDEISSLSLETTKRLLSQSDNNSDSMTEFKAKINDLKNEKALLLKSNGFSSDYMDMHYRCSDCKDTGYINNIKCHCFKKAEISILYEQSNLGEILKTHNFNLFNIDLFDDNTVDLATGKTPKQNIINALNVCHNYIDSFGQNDAKFKNLLFFGKTGVGKTFLTYCIAKELIEKSASVIYLSSISLFDILSDATFDKSNTDAKNKENQLYNCDLLIIDDLGTELSNSFTNSAFFNLINERLIKNKSIIISTNLDFSELMERYSERIASRLTRDYTFLKIYGEDLRHRIKLA